MFAALARTVQRGVAINYQLSIPFNFLSILTALASAAGHLQAHSGSNDPNLRCKRSLTPTFLSSRKVFFHVSLPSPQPHIFDVHRLATAPPTEVILPNEERFLTPAKPIIQDLLQTLRLNHCLVRSQVPDLLDPCLQSLLSLPVFVFVLAAKERKREVSRPY